MSGKKKTAVILLCSIIVICIAFIANLFIANHQMKLDRQSQLEEQYINEVLEPVNEIYSKFTDSNDRLYRVALYNDLLNYRVQVYQSSHVFEKIDERFGQIISIMQGSLSVDYNNLIDEAIADAADDINGRQTYVNTVKSAIEDVYGRFNGIETNTVANEGTETSRSFDANAGISEKISLYNELLDMRHNFAAGNSSDNSKQSVLQCIEELNKIRDIISREGVLHNTSNSDLLYRRIDDLIRLYNRELEGEEYEEMIRTFNAAIDRAKSWFSSYYSSVINDIAAVPRVDENDIAAINKQISNLQALKQATLSSHVFGDCKFCCMDSGDENPDNGTRESEEGSAGDSLEITTPLTSGTQQADAERLRALHSKIDELIESLNREIDAINNRINDEQPDGTSDTGGSADSSDTNSGSDNLEIPSLVNINDFAEEVLRLTNIERANHGLAPLTADNSLLSYSAHVRAIEIITYWSHDRPDGRSCFTVYTDAGGQYNRLGENLAAGQRTPDEAVRAWMNSEGHRTNMLDANYTQIGIGVVRDANGRYYWAQMFCG